MRKARSGGHRMRLTVPRSIHRSGFPRRYVLGDITRVGWRTPDKRGPTLRRLCPTPMRHNKGAGLAGGRRGWERGRRLGGHISRPHGTHRRGRRQLEGKPAARRRTDVARRNDIRYPIFQTPFIAKVLAKRYPKVANHIHRTTAQRLNGSRQRHRTDVNLRAGGALTRKALASVHCAPLCGTLTAAAAAPFPGSRVLVAPFVKRPAPTPENDWPLRPEDNRQNINSFRYCQRNSRT
jgi:hypothetical protein